jgi:hypothetical protein
MREQADDGSAEQAPDQSKKAKEQVPKDRHLTSCIPRKLRAAHVHSSCIHLCTTLHRGSMLEQKSDTISLSNKRVHSLLFGLGYHLTKYVLYLPLMLYLESGFSFER